MLFDGVMVHIIQIEKLVSGGDGLGRLNGKVILVPLVIPGENVKVRILEQKRGYDKAELLEVLEPSPERTDPRCPWFGVCGGCNWQHIHYRAQIIFKKAIFEDAMTRIGKLTFPPPVIEYREPWNYRNRARFQADSEGNLGFLRRGSNTLIDLRDCPVLHPGLSELLKSREKILNTYFKETFKWTRPGEKRKLNVFAAEDWLAHPADPDPLGNGGRLRVRILEKPIDFSLNCFFQSNLGMLPRTIRYLIDGVNGENAMDLYCGVGLYSAFLSDCFRHIYAIEQDPIATGFASKNITLPGAVILNKRVEHLSADGFVGQVDMAIVNPPRTGLSRIARKYLAEVCPHELVYVSCHPVTLARDLDSLVNRGPFNIQDIKLFDYYPQTDSVESIVRLVMRK
jgi:23S rRNA (uracil1939-C5)-methyltransferase